MRWILIAVLSWWALVNSSLGAGRFVPFEAQWPKTDFSLLRVDLAEIQSGGPPKDGIPAIDQPKFVEFAQADEWLGPQEPVIALSIRGQARAYPLQILTFHEIVNDRLAQVPVAVTFCPLCNAAIVFDRRLEGRLLDFGTTGLLRKSDLVMYDRQTQSWWQQFTGEGIVGALAGKELQRWPAAIIAYADFKRDYPHGEVLSRATGHRRPYGRNPYRGYDAIDSNPFLLGEAPSDRLAPMERVLAVSQGARVRLHPFSALTQTPVVNTQLGPLRYAIFAAGQVRSALDGARIRESRSVLAVRAFDRQVAGRLLEFEWRDEVIRDRQTGSQWNPQGRALAGPLKDTQLRPVDEGVHFAFAWLAFRPDAEIYPGP